MYPRCLLGRELTADQRFIWQEITPLLTADKSLCVKRYFQFWSLASPHEASRTVFFRKLVKRVNFFGILISFSHISILNVLNKHIFSQSIQIWFILQLCESYWVLFVVFSVARKQGQTDSAGKYNFKCHPATYRRNAQGKRDRRHAKYWVYWQTVKWHEYEFWRGVWWIWRSTKIPTSKWVKLVNRTLFYLML